MILDVGNISQRGRAWLRLALASVAVMLACAAAADGPGRDQPGDVQGLIGPLIADDSGLIGVIGRWIDESASGITSQFKGTRESIDDATAKAGDAAKNAAASVARLPTAGVVAGRERCATAANGAADCAGAVEALCRTKGFTGGRSLDVEAARNCRPEGLRITCPTESFVTRAVCQ